MNVIVNLSFALPVAHEDKSAAVPADTLELDITRQLGTDAPVSLGKADLTTSPSSFQDKNPAPGVYQYFATPVDKYGQAGKVSDGFPVDVPAAPSPLDEPTIINGVVTITP